MYYTLKRIDTCYTCNFYGHIKMKVLEKALDTLEHYPKNNEINKLLLDLSEIDSSDVSMSNANFMASHDVKFTLSLEHPIQLAFVYHDRNTLFFLLRFTKEISKMRRNFTVRIFESTADATHWLELDSAQGDENSSQFA